MKDWIPKAAAPAPAPPVSSFKVGDRLGTFKELIKITMNNNEQKC